MSENEEKIESGAKKAGDTVGAGAKKSAKAINDFGKGIKKGIKREE